MADYVIDASSVLVFIFNEPGAGIVIEIARDDHLLISTVNLAEVLAKLADRGADGPMAQQLLAPLDLEEVSFNSAQARISAMLRPATKGAGLSLGDRSCLALALAEGKPVLTADRNWLGITDGIGVAVTITRPKLD